MYRLKKTFLSEGGDATQCTRHAWQRGREWGARTGASTMPDTGNQQPRTDTDNVCLRRRKKMKKFLLLAGILITAMVLAACGGTTPAATTAPEATEEMTPEMTEEMTPEATE